MGGGGQGNKLGHEPTGHSGVWLPLAGPLGTLFILKINIYTSPLLPGDQHWSLAEREYSPFRSIPLEAVIRQD